MNVFVINCGSSSIKYQLFHLPSHQPLCSGLVERIGLPDGIITHRTFVRAEDEITRIEMQVPDHHTGLEKVVELLTAKGSGVITSTEEIKVIGHRAVHGGISFNKTTFITPEVKQKIKDLFALAPLHNPANYTGIEVAEAIFPHAQQIAVFDTAFHHTLPQKAYRYAIPKELYEQKHIRAFGFHGISHQYVSKRAADYLGNSHAKIITIHLGNGSSMTAVDNGKSIDQSMGFGPMGGLIMGTRCGDFDLSAIFHLLKNGYTPEGLDVVLNKKSGMTGLTGKSDMRDVTAMIEAGDEDAALAYEMYAYRIKKYIGTFTAAMNGLDAIVFTGGIGENDAMVREMVCSEMDFFGIVADVEKNRQRPRGIAEIQAENSRVKILIVPTNEELEIALECSKLVASTD